MKNFVRIVLPLAMVGLAGCDPLMYGKLDEPSIAITQGLPSAPGLPALEVPSVTLAQQTFQLGDITVDESSKDSRVTVNQAILEITAVTPANATTSFAGIKTAAVSVAAPPGSSLPTQTVATYDQTRDGPAGTALTLKGADGVNLVPYITGKSLVVNLTASGVPPGPLGTSWTSDLTLDLHIIAQKNLP
jgi:hypothetical protein